MIILKSFCLLLIFLISTQIGFIKANSYKIRVNNLKNIVTSLNFFKTKIRYTNESIKEIFNQISKVIYDGKENIFFYTITNLKKDKLYENWCKALINEKILKEDDKEILKVFGKNLGKLDRIGQLNQIEETIILLEKQINIAQIEKDKNEKLYRSLGSIIGIAIVIIFI